MIRFENVKKVYEATGKNPEIVALQNVNLHIRKGEFVFVLGHSGAGKSTFLKLILREEAATEGRVIVNGRDLTTIKPRQIPYPVSYTHLDVYKRQEYCWMQIYFPKVLMYLFQFSSIIQYMIDCINVT